ncbi:MAG: hypothetical protein BWY21_00845 [Parcubacteria group bacterium ADurb.Bin216]|jgi:predicted transcriptional regulator of viral defense system|nr:MAG: hypothetical protein BWY21_00845 [Parcubacteria group bacterium ADurb.Bin216]
MRNDYSDLKKLLESASNLPYFEVTDFLAINSDNYVKILISRYAKRGELVRLKKGIYVSKSYIDSVNRDVYGEFVANILYEPSYLSLEYVLSEYGIMTESVKNFTSVSLLRTNSFSNVLGHYFYHKVRNDLFLGFDIIKEGDLRILKATKAKALFDYLYLRKNILNKDDSLAELRLNLENVLPRDWKEFGRYVDIEGSEKMKSIYDYLKKWRY